MADQLRLPLPDDPAPEWIEALIAEMEALDLVAAIVLVEAIDEPLGPIQ